MNRKNCPNCGAPYDVELNTCPYCKTSYFDMSCIDMEDRKPFYLKLKINGMVFISKVITDPSTSTTFKQEDKTISDMSGNIILRETIDKYIDIDMRFHSVPDYKNNKTILYTLETN